MSGRTVYNYFRDYDPATGRYVESDPIGLRGGINTYAYGNGSPVMAIDPTGLLSFDSKETWTDVPEFKEERYKGAGGVTEGYIEGVSCRCENSCGWKLIGCAAMFHIKVRILDSLWGPQRRFVRTSESQHVADLRAGREAIRAAGEAAEAAAREKIFSSKAACESAAGKAVTNALWAAVNRVELGSAMKYDPPFSERHIWRWHYWLMY